MVNTKEIRKGNLLFLRNKIIKVDGFDNHTIYHNNGFDVLSDDTFKPISVTEEILLKSEFEKIGHFTVSNSIIKSIGRNRQISVSAVDTANVMVWLCEMNGDDSRKIDDLICLHNYDYDGDLYLHKLQNLYYLLANKDLDVSKLLNE